MATESLGPQTPAAPAARREIPSRGSHVQALNCEKLPEQSPSFRLNAQIDFQTLLGPGGDLAPEAGAGGPSVVELSAQVPPSPSLCVLMLALVGVAPALAGRHACSVPAVLHHYRSVIFKDLQTAVRQAQVEETGKGARHSHFTLNYRWRDLAGSSCKAQKEHSILTSIASLGRTLRGAVSGHRRGALERAAWTVAVRTEAVMRRYCWKQRQQSPWHSVRLSVKQRGGRRRLVLRALDAIATCWEKLFAQRTTGKDQGSPMALELTPPLPRAGSAKS
ncbi:uncharacterized protein C20orf204 homolog [Rhynchocyon petersi]